MNIVLDFWKLRVNTVLQYIQRKINAPKKEIWQTHLDESVHYKVFIIFSFSWHGWFSAERSRRSLVLVRCRPNITFDLESFVSKNWNSHKMDWSRRACHGKSLISSPILMEKFRRKKSEKSTKKMLENEPVHFNLKERISDQIGQLEGLENRFITGLEI